MKRFLIPIVLFIVLIGFLAVGLKRDPRDVPSPLVGKPAPAFSLPMLVGGQSLSPQDMRGKVWLFNVWASWCVSCRDEHPVLVKFVKSGKMPEILIVGLNYKDQTDDAKAWLARFGNPYTLSLVDADGRVGIDYYVAVDFQAVIDFVDLMGGVVIEVPERIDDQSYPDNCYGYDPLTIGTSAPSRATSSPR